MTHALPLLLIANAVLTLALIRLVLLLLRSHRLNRAKVDEGVAAVKAAAQQSLDLRDEIAAALRQHDRKMAQAQQDADGWVALQRFKATLPGKDGR
jgi:hypothetical protein